MTKQAFDKIMTGLIEALDFAKSNGNRQSYVTRMREAFPPMAKGLEREEITPTPHLRWENGSLRQLCVVRSWSDIGFERTPVEQWIDVPEANGR